MTPLDPTPPPAVSAAIARPGAVNLAGYRLVTLCGSAGSKHDAMRDSQDKLEPVLAARGVDIRPVDLGDWSLGAVPKLLREIARQRPDGLLMQYPTGAFGHSTGPIALSLLQRSAPLMVMLHEFVAAHPLRKVAVGALLQRASRIGTTAEREAAALGRVFPWLRRRLRHVPIASNIPGRNWVPASPPRVVYFGQLRPDKGIEEFFACHDLVAREFPGVVFQIIGAVVPKLAAYGAQIIADATGRGIEMVLDLESDAVADALSMASVALLPFPDGASFRRGSLFAAAASGVPLVTSIGDDTPPELRALLPAGGSDVAELAALLRRCLNDKAMLQELHRSSRQIDSRFGWEQTADYYMAALAEMSRPAVAVAAARVEAGA